MARRAVALGVFGALLIAVPAAPTQSDRLPPPREVTKEPSKVSPKLEPVAETRLLMEGLAHANFRGIERILKEKPAEAQAWTFVRGQALLIAETANLLML